LKEGIVWTKNKAETGKSLYEIYKHKNEIVKELKL
jgi:hypothetical protein